MFKKSILLGKLNETEQYFSKVVIGVVGIEHGVGTTHLAILLAHYYHKWLHRKTIFIECCQNEVGFLNKDLDDEDFSDESFHNMNYHYPNKRVSIMNYHEMNVYEKDINKNFLCDRTNQNKSFHMYGIDWYRSVSQREVASIMGREYECAIIDFGCHYNKAFDELLRCNYKIIVGHHALWKQYHLRNFIDGMREHYNESWLYVLPFMEVKELEYLNKLLSVRCYTFPFEPNPFHLSKKSLLALEELF